MASAKREDEAKPLLSIWKRGVLLVQGFAAAAPWTLWTGNPPWWGVLACQGLLEMSTQTEQLEQEV